MVSVRKRNYNTNITEFYADEVEDVDLLPTLTTKGKNNLSTLNSVGVGSSCFVISTGDIYMLKGTTNSWVKRTLSGNGSGGGVVVTPDLDYATDDDIKNLFK